MSWLELCDRLCGQIEPQGVQRLCNTEPRERVARSAEAAGCLGVGLVSEGALVALPPRHVGNATNHRGREDSKTAATLGQRRAVTR